MSTDDRTGNRRSWTGGDLALRVRRRRGALGLSQEEVATRARMDPGYLDHVEHAPAAPTAGALIRLADALDTTVADLLGSQPKRPPGHGRAALHPVLEEMRAEESRSLLEAGGVGRVAFNLAGRLTVIPVNFEMYKGQVVFRTSGTNAVARYGADSVSFEVDRIDEGMREGWSVLISGRARQAAGKELQQLRSALAVEPWVGGARGVYIVIEPEQISGRRVRAW
jgi:transcriptional regulator with XRE-family HTH domain